MIRVDGAATLSERLEAIAGSVAQNLAAAVAEEAGALQAEAKRRCPADSGALKDSIRAQVRAQGAEFEVTVGSGLAYAKSVELGTLHCPPAPYLAPVANARKSAITERIKQAVRRALKE